MNVGLFLIFAAAATPAQPLGSPPEVGPAAIALIERDWVLTNWALKYFDKDGDLLIDPKEASAAAAAFRKIADTNHDGRITPEEYRAARALILSRD